jgi:hypothetical protein
MRLVVVGDADEHRAFGRQFLAGGDLRLGKGLAEVVGHAHHFSGGAHLGAKNRVDAGKFDHGKTGDFT